MAIRIHCPNAACGQVIIVPDDYAGKRGKCVTCGTAMTVPTVAASETIVQAPPAEPDRPRREDGTSAPPVRAPAAVATHDGKRLSSAGSEEVAEPSPVPADGSWAGPRMAELTTRTALIVGIAALVVLSFLPQVPWVWVTEPSRAAQAGQRARDVQFIISMTTGPSLFPTLLLYSALLSVLAVLGLLSLELLPSERSDSVIATVGGLAGGWGVTVLLVMLGYIVKAFVTASEHGSKQLTILPGIGPVLGLVAALAVLAASGYLLTSRRRLLWLAGASVLGLVFGIFLVIFAARPWEPWHVG